jgi:8-oxo-dGTP pyrophosphatase MutT (NUDIX family)
VTRESVAPWQKVSSEPVSDCKVFTVRRERAAPPGQDASQARNFFVIHATDWVNVIPVTPDGDVIFVEQYRHGVDQICLEVPGGMIDPEDPSPAAAAARELLEETGYVADDLILLGKNHPNPAIQNNSCYSFLARNARFVQPPQFDGTEDLVVRRIPLADVPRRMANGEITHALVIVAFHWLHLHGLSDAVRPSDG